MQLFEQYISEINELCNQHKVGELYAFGSVLTDDFNPDSDIDLLIQCMTKKVLKCLYDVIIS